MSKKTQLRSIVELIGEPDSLAEMFCELDDDEQARFFVAVAKIMRSWPKNCLGVDAFEWQADAIGRHLRNCQCATDDARLFIRIVHEATAESGF